MKEIEISIKIRHYQLEELPEEERELVNTAIKATDNAYADYSHFYVGAALRLSDGTVVIGANQENAAYPSGLCAARTAIFAAQANHPDKHITCLAIAARNDNGLLKSPITPCGACRQVIVGVEDRYKKPIKIMLYGTDGVYCLESARDLMPLSFIDDSMK